MFIFAHHKRLGFALRNAHRNDFRAEVTCCLGSRVALLAAQRESILIFARDTVLIGQILGG